MDWSDGLTNVAVALDGEGQAVGTIITETVGDQGQLFGLYTCCRP